MLRQGWCYFTSGTWPAVTWGTGSGNTPKALTKRGSRCPSLLGRREAEGIHDEFILGLYLAEGLTVSFRPVTMVEPLPHVHQASSQHTGIAAPPQPGMETFLEKETTVDLCQWDTPELQTLGSVMDTTCIKSLYIQQSQTTCRILLSQ